jgi:hypothetical protein
VITVLSIARRTTFAQNFVAVLLVPDSEAATEQPAYQGTTSLRAENPVGAKLISRTLPIQFRTGFSR